MFAAHGTAQAGDSIAVVIVLLATMLVVFWRAVIRLVITILATGIIVVLSYGVITISESMHHVIR